MSYSRLYRGKSIKTGELYEGGYAELSVTGNVKPYIVPAHTGDLHFIEIIPNTLQESTGADDKNGTPIWQYNECILTALPFNFCHAGISDTTVRGYVDFIDGAFVFIEYLYHNMIELFNLRNKGFEIEVVSQWYDEKAYSAFD